MKSNFRKIFDFIKSNWYFSLLVIPFVSFCVANRVPDNDIWFIMNNGRYVLSNGIPYIEPFTIHQGFSYVMQQWLSAILFYGSYHLFGKLGLLGLVTIVYFVISFVYYKICFLLTSNKKTSLLVTVLVMLFSYEYIISRPQIFTYLILLIELFCLEKYCKTNDYKKLICLPFLSLLSINMHASVWLLQFVFMLPFICNGIKIKNITINKVKVKPLLITFVLMFLAGFINPYGYKAMTFIFSIFGIPEINKLVAEMQPSSFIMFHYKLALLLLIANVILICINRKVKLDIRFILLLCGGFVFASMHAKCVIYFFWYGCFVLAKVLEGYKDFTFKIDIKNKIIKSLGRGLSIGLFFSLVVTFVFTSIEIVKHFRMKTNYIYDVVDYIEDNYEKESIILYVDFNDGGYTEFRGIKSYIDPRAEVFFNRLNRKENILTEYLSLSEEDTNFKEFVNKYSFSHLIVENGSYLEKYLATDENYVKEYTHYYNGTVPMYDLYVKK